MIRLIAFENFQHAWLTDEKTALYCVIFTISWQWVGYYMVLYLSELAMIPDDLIEAGKIDGANSRQILINIIIPFLKPIFQITCVLAIVNSFKGFDLMYIMTQGGPNLSTYLLALHMYDTSFGRMQYGYGSSIAVIIILLCVLFMKENPHIKIEKVVIGGAGGDNYRTKLASEAAVGNLTDIFMTWLGVRLEPMVQMGTVMPLDDIISEDEALSCMVDRSVLDNIISNSQKLWISW
ncbi:Binding-protein-dependent transport system inner membrane component [Clostridium grantii DSM 8605]|uniref:Binding-protein-dependent transport system inner membrane component n=1 Tax=Clostridium grantii DSM 8605 TaxID=1121316 RepID=A0A1M5SVU6_9CLOT|nr:Binding-protein-dependent transport system inner membrane component [Clostridium grantii DSM 8605]